MPAKKGKKKDFSKEQMYAKIMPSLTSTPELEEELPKAPLPKQPEAEPEEMDAVQPHPGYLLRNYMEDIVLERVNHTMQMLRACGCEKCKKDVMALALNALPPSYAAIPPDEVRSHVQSLRSGVEVKVSAAIIKAVQEVKQNPPHEPEEQQG